MNRTIAVADIGGTHARFALAHIRAGKVCSTEAPVTLNTGDYASFQTAWQAFCAKLDQAPPEAIGIAFAGPVGGEVLKLTNNPWVIRPAKMQEKLGVSDFVIVNDFGAIAHAVGALDEEHFMHLFGPEIPLPHEGVVSIVGPGTGLGVAQLLKRDGIAHVIESEGGHIDFAPLDTLEDEILKRLRRRYRRVSIERVACGSALVNLYETLGAIEGKAVREMDDKALWQMALEGDDPIAAAALDRFFLTLGAAAGDIALAHGAGAVVIAGGLGYRIREHFKSSGFHDRFIAKGRFERRMEALPIKLVTHPQPGLFGAAVAFAAHARSKSS